MTKAEFIRDFIADDDLYALYDTTEQVDRMIKDAKSERDARQDAFDLLFKHKDDAENVPVEDTQA